jgi:hypothetical protein
VNDVFAITTEFSLYTPGACYMLSECVNRPLNWMQCRCIASIFFVRETVFVYLFIYPFIEIKWQLIDIDDKISKQ